MSSGWQVYQLADDRAAYGNTAGCYVVTTGDHDAEICGPILDLRHARLIAAAPELLVVARKALAAWTGDGPPIDLDELRAVIALAEGPL